MKGNGSASQRGRQGQHPKAFGLSVHQRAHIGRLVSMRTFNLGRVANHKVRRLVEKQFEASLGILLLQKSLDALVTGSSVPLAFGLQSHSAVASGLP